jgi:hypothetical protein
MLTGEAVPPEVLKGIEKQAVAACRRAKGTIRYARADARYRMAFEAAGESSRRGLIASSGKIAFSAARDAWHSEAPTPAGNWGLPS